MLNSAFNIPEDQLQGNFIQSEILQISNSNPSLRDIELPEVHEQDIEEIEIEDDNASSISRSQQQPLAGFLDTKRKYKALVANDDQCQLYMIEVILKLNNFEVTVAQNGYEAFELASEAFRYKQANLSSIIEQWANPLFMANA